MKPARVQAVDWGWRHHGRKAFAVRGLQLSVEPGERVLLLGASGSGKSTVLAGLAGLLEADGSAERRDEGHLSVDGLPAGHPDLRGQVGLVLQDPAAQTILARCGDDVAFGCENLGIPPEETWRRVDAALAAVGLAEQGIGRDRPTEFLSGGQRQRLALAGVVAMRPGLLLLDEPTANLDPAGVIEVRDAVRAVLDTTGATLIVVEHRVSTWLEVVDRVVVLEPGGGVRADGPPAEVLARLGPELAAGGVWVPGLPPQLPQRPSRGHVAEPGRWLLRGEQFAVAPAEGSAIVARGLEITVEAGRCLAIEGVNGAGKSTTALTLAGLLPPRTGRVVAAETLAAGTRARQRRWRRRTRPDPPGSASGNPTVNTGPWSWRSVDLLTRVGMVFQDPEHQFLAQTVRAELTHGPLRAGQSEQAAGRRAEELLDRLGLTRLAEANPFTLSGGEKRRLSVATAIATRPSVLVLDEPTFGQDRNSWAQIVRLIAELVDDGLAAVVVTHDDLVSEALADDRYLVPPSREAG